MEVLLIDIYPKIHRKLKTLFSLDLARTLTLESLFIKIVGILNTTAPIYSTTKLTQICHQIFEVPP